MNKESHILNTEVINDLINIIGDDLVEIYIEFNTSTILNFEKANIALTDNDLDQLSTIIHSVKGAAGNIGLELLSNQCHSFESGLRKNESIDHSQILKSIEHTFKISIDELVKKGLLS